MNKTASLNTYSHFSPKMEWIEQFFEFKDEFKTNHTLGKNMYDFFIPFLRHAGLIDANGFSRTASVLDSLGLSNEAVWGIMLVNLAHTRQVQWVVTTIPFNTVMTKEELALRMIEDGAKETWTSDVFTSITRLGALPFGDMGFGKTTKIKREAWFERTPWSTPIPEIILYSLYKFAEACGDYHGRDLINELNYYDERLKDGSYIITVRNPNADWKTWIKTIGIIESIAGDDYTISFRDSRHIFSLREEQDGYSVLIPPTDVKDVDFMRQVLAEAEVRARQKFTPKKFRTPEWEDRTSEMRKAADMVSEDASASMRERASQRDMGGFPESDD